MNIDRLGPGFGDGDEVRNMGVKQRGSNDHVWLPVADSKVVDTCGGCCRWTRSAKCAQIVVKCLKIDHGLYAERNERRSTLKVRLGPAPERTRGHHAEICDGGRQRRGAR